MTKSATAAHSPIAPTNSRDSGLMLTVEMTRDEWEAVLDAINWTIATEREDPWRLKRARDAIRLGIGTIHGALYSRQND